MMVTACTPSVEDQIGGAEALLRNRDYDGAIASFQEVIDKDPSQFDAWHGYVKALVRDGKYAHAEQALEGYFEAVEAAYDTNSDVVNRDLIRDVVNFARDIRSEGERLGEWYHVLDLPTLEIYDLSGNYDVGDSISLEVPEGSSLYYTLDGSEPDSRDMAQRYSQPIVIEEEGELSLQVIAVNAYGMESEPSYAWISSYTRPEALAASVPGGSYDAGVQIFFEDYDEATMSLTYTIDGSDPIDYGLYYDPYYGIELNHGDYTLRAVYYDYDTYEYSKETVVEYSLANPYEISAYTEITVAIYDLHDWVGAEIEYAISDINTNFPDLWVSYYYVDSLEALEEDLASGYAHLVYCPSSYVESLAAEDLIAPIEGAFNYMAEDYYNHALEAGVYASDYYTLPVTISPNQMLYYNLADIAGDYSVDIDTWDQLVTVANNGVSNYNYLYPMDDGGKWLLSFYLGLGGSMEMNANGGYNMDEDKMVEAMRFAYQLPEIYGLGLMGMDELTYRDAISNATATMLYGDMAYMDYYNGSWSYTPSGPMPLPNGSLASAINLVDGLHIGPSILEDDNAIVGTQLIYDYLSSGPYVNYIAGYGEAIPARRSEVDINELYLYGEFSDYERAVIANTTLANNQKLGEVIKAISYGMYAVVYEAGDIEATAKTIVEAAKWP